MQKFLSSSFFILTTIALLSGASGAVLSGMWDFRSPQAGMYSHGTYLDGAKFGVFLTTIALVPYWAFNLIRGNAFKQWKAIDKKIWRVSWVLCWATFIGFFFSRSLAI